MEGHCGEKWDLQLYFFILVEITNERSDRLSSNKNKDITVDTHKVFHTVPKWAKFLLRHINKFVRQER